MSSDGLSLDHASPVPLLPVMSVELLPFSVHTAGRVRPNSGGQSAKSHHWLK